MDLWERVRDVAYELELAWGMRAHVIIACCGFKDEHVQFYHPKHLGMPVLIMDVTTGKTERHPDSPV